MDFSDFRDDLDTKENKDRFFAGLPNIPKKKKDAPKKDKADKKGKKGVRKKGKKRVVAEGKVYIKASFNNTIVTFTDLNGDVLAWGTAGASGFKGTRKSTPYAAQIAAENASEKAKAYGVEKVDVFVKGIGPGRAKFLREFFEREYQL